MLGNVETHWEQTDRQTCLSVWTSAVFVSEPPQAASTDLHPDLYSPIIVIQFSLSSLFLSQSCLCIWLNTGCIFFFNTRNAIFLFAKNKNKKKMKTLNPCCFLRDAFGKELSGGQNRSYSLLRSCFIWCNNTMISLWNDVVLFRCVPANNWSTLISGGI